MGICLQEPSVFTNAEKHASPGPVPFYTTVLAEAFVDGSPFQNYLFCYVQKTLSTWITRPCKWRENAETSSQSWPDLADSSFSLSATIQKGYWKDPCSRNSDPITCSDPSDRWTSSLFTVDAFFHSAPTLCAAATRILFAFALVVARTFTSHPHRNQKSLNLVIDSDQRHTLRSCCKKCTLFRLYL